MARLKGFRRVFAHVAPIFFERGIAKPETKVSDPFFSFNLEIFGLSLDDYELSNHYSSPFGYHPRHILF